LGFEPLEVRQLLALTVGFGGSSLVEGQALPSATITRTGSTASALVVTLSSSLPAVAAVPTTVTILAGQASALFTVTAPTDGVVDESVSVSISATAAGHSLTSSSLAIVNAEVLALRPGAANDALTLTPMTVARQFEVTGATPEYWAPAVVDLSVDAAADQRTALGLGSGDPSLPTGYFSATSLVKMSPTLRYVISGDASARYVGSDERPLAFASYDRDQLVIEPVHVRRYFLAVDTTLAAAVAPGATSILVTNASGWSNDVWEDGATRALAWYGYSDSTGQTYANYTYTRNVATGGAGGLWAPGAIHYDSTAGAYRIELTAPWSGPALAAGAAIRNAHAGSALSFPDVTPVSNGGSGAAALMSATVGGTTASGNASGMPFPVGTAYIRPAAIIRNSWAGISIAPESDAALGPLNFTLPVAEATTTGRVVLDLDVLVKNAFGPAANVVIQSVTPPASGAAAIVTLPSGRSILRYTSTPSFFGTETIAFVVRNVTTNATVTGQIAVTIVDTTEAQRIAKLRSVALGMLNYESSLQRLPIAPTASHFNGSGNPYLSWRVHILPYLGYQTLYNQFRLNEAWNSAHNLPLAAQMPAEFRDPRAAFNATTTRIRIISGDGAPYYWRRSNGLLVGPRYSDVEDGVQNTLMAVEVAASAAINWTQPDLPNFNPANPLSALGSMTDDWFRAVTMDGTVMTLPKTIAPAVFTGLVTVAGDELIDAATLQRQYAEMQGPAAVAALDAARADQPLKAISLGMFNYHDVWSRFPLHSTTSSYDANGNPLLSWRVHILPYIGYANLYERFHLNEPWDSPNNLPLLALMPDVFRGVGDASSSTATRLQTFTGPDAPFEYRAAGQFQTGPRVSDIGDGSTDTIMFVETGASAAVPWTKPADVALDVTNPKPGLGNLSGDSFRAMMFDGVGRRFSTSIAPATLAALATRSRRELVSAAANTVGGSTVPATANNLKQIAVAMLDAESARGSFLANRFAADGTPLLSWRVLMLPYLGLQSLYSQFHLNEPWDSPHNLTLLPYMPAVLRSADDPLDTALTRVMTFVGPGAPFPASGTTSTRGPTFNEITDGTSATYMFVEAGRDVSAPWTKPADLPYYAANPRSQLGDIGGTLNAAYFNGAVFAETGAATISELTARITHQGGSSGNSPPAVPSVRQSHGDTRLRELGADWIDVVFDAAPTTLQTLLLSISDSGVALLDKQSLTFDASNWNVPQRVLVRGVDNFEVNADRTVTITIGTLQLAATVINDDAAPPNADFDSDGMVNGNDFLAWQRGLGIAAGATRAQGDADHNGSVDVADLAIWRGQFPLPAAVPDFDRNGAVNGNDFLAWQRQLGAPAAPAGAGADGDRSGTVDAGDLDVWRNAMDELAEHVAASTSASVVAADGELERGDEFPWGDTAGAPSAAAHDALFAAGDFTQLFAPASDEAPSGGRRRLRYRPVIA
jgi:hypothetical protein